MDEIFSDFVSKIFQNRKLDTGFRENLKRACRVMDFDEGDHWPRRSLSNRKLPYIYSGSAMGLRKDGKKQLVMSLWKAGEVVFAGSTLLAKPHPADRIEFLEAARILSLDLEKIKNMYGEFEDARYLGSRLFMVHIDRMEEQYVRMCFKYPEERLRETLELYPGVFPLLKPAQKASYLGISKSTLYKIA